MSYIAGMFLMNMEEEVRVGLDTTLRVIYCKGTELYTQTDIRGLSTRLVPHSHQLNYFN